MLAVVVADVAVEGEYQFERCRFGTSPDQLRLLAEWLIQQKAEEVVWSAKRSCDGKSRSSNAL
jgi:hypothetical protein